MQPASFLEVFAYYMTDLSSVLPPSTSTSGNGTEQKNNTLALQQAYADWSGYKEPTLEQSAEIQAQKKAVEATQKRRGRAVEVKPGRQSNLGSPVNQADYNFSMIQQMLDTQNSLGKVPVKAEAPVAVSPKKQVIAPISISNLGELLKSAGKDIADGAKAVATAATTDAVINVTGGDAQRHNEAKQARIEETRRLVDAFRPRIARVNAVAEQTHQSTLAKSSDYQETQALLQKAHVANSLSMGTNILRALAGLAPMQKFKETIAKKHSAIEADKTYTERQKKKQNSISTATKTPSGPGSNLGVRSSRDKGGREVSGAVGAN